MSFPSESHFLADPDELVEVEVEDEVE